MIQTNLSTGERWMIAVEGEALGLGLIRGPARVKEGVEGQEGRELAQAKICVLVLFCRCTLFSFSGSEGQPTVSSNFFPYFEPDPLIAPLRGILRFPPGAGAGL